MFTRLLLNEIYRLIELPFEWLIDDAMFVCFLDELILGFYYSNLTSETGRFELASTITLVLQANQLTKCARKFHAECACFFKFSFLTKKEQLLITALKTPVDSYLDYWIILICLVMVKNWGRSKNWHCYWHVLERNLVVVLPG